MKKYLLTICGLAIIATLVSCGDNKKESSASESTSVVETTATLTKEATTEKKTDNITEPATKEETEPTTSKTPEIEFVDKYYYNGISIGLSRGWKARTIKNYCGYISCSYFGSITITCTESNCLDNSDYIASHNTEEIYENTNSIKLITAIISDDYNNPCTCFKCCIQGKEMSVEFSPYFPEEQMYQIINTLKFEEINAEQATEKQNETTEPITEKPAPNSNETLGQKNALKSAKSYVEFSGFSYQGLIEQLEYEKYSHEEAVYGADNCGANWNDEALESAKSYIDYSGFSYQRLLEQLEHEKFTHEQAIYGADNCGADWFQEAAECAESYINFSLFSREELLDQLLYDGFTQEQAEYGVRSVGY